MPSLELHHSFADFSKDCFQIGISPDGHFVALATADRPEVVSLYDISGKKFAELSPHNGPISSIDFSPDGRFLASASLDGMVKIWRSTGELISVFDRFESPPELIAFAPQVPIIAAAERKGLVVLFDIEGNYIATLHSPKGHMHSISWSQDNDYITASCIDHNLYFYNIVKQKKRVFIHPNEVLGGILSGKGEEEERSLISICADGFLRKIPLDRSEPTNWAKIDSPVAGINPITQNGHTICASAKGIVYIHDSFGNEVLRQPLGRQIRRLMQITDCGQMLFLSSNGSLMAYRLLNLDNSTQNISND